jgi:hypothetical protein
MPAVPQHELHIDFPLRGTLPTVGFGLSVRGRKGDLAVATNLPSNQHLPVDPLSPPIKEIL